MQLCGNQGVGPERMSVTSGRAAMEKLPRIRDSLTACSAQGFNTEPSRWRLMAQGVWAPPTKILEAFTMRRVLVLSPWVAPDGVGSLRSANEDSGGLYNA